MFQCDAEDGSACRQPGEAEQEPHPPQPVAETQPQFAVEHARQGAAADVDFPCQLFQRHRTGGLGDQFLAQPGKARVAGHRNVQMQARRRLDLIEDEVHHPLVPAAGSIVERDARSGDNGLAQERRHLHHLALSGQAGPGIFSHENGAHGHIPSDPDRMITLRRHPHGAPGRNDPATFRRRYRHDAAQCVNQLCPSMAMGGDVLAIGVVAGECRDGAQRRFAILNCTQSVHNATMIVIFPSE